MTSVALRKFAMAWCGGLVLGACLALGVYLAFWRGACLALGAWRGEYQDFSPSRSISYSYQTYHIENRHPPHINRCLHVFPHPSPNNTRYSMLHMSSPIPLRMPNISSCFSPTRSRLQRYIRQAYSSRHCILQYNQGEDRLSSWEWYVLPFIVVL